MAGMGHSRAPPTRARSPEPTPAPGRRLRTMSKPIPYEVPIFDSVEDERRHIKIRLAAAFRLFGKFGFSEGVAGHITARDPEHVDCFWVNPFGVDFSLMRTSD